ncbi:hypothetical protein SASPL_149910 [Salvia splendens]|uniref:Syringolide-induced protein 14-1-1 n=1 Tax=Salvia splendens TaxID=180675 RepID=A0A8X8Z197_SALSN|nr:uncharacterized protein At1g76070-like [Salvia splendens]KAG6388482.1 hypothetical protein SASPL_149910 [Salvia splendens]
MNSPKNAKEKKPSSKSKNKILRLLPKAAQAAVSFQNPAFSPGRAKGFSGPMIPAEARGKSKNFETQEPTSPKISCMGQIKHKKKMCKKQTSLPRGFKPAVNPGPERVDKAQSSGSGLMKMFSGRRKSDASIDKPPLAERAPSLSQMRRFASSRDTFAGFDWKAAQITPDSGEDSDGEDGGAGIPFSAPMLMAGAGGFVLEPRKEINLWKRRTMAQPKPIQVNIARAL